MLNPVVSTSEVTSAPHWMTGVRQVGATLFQLATRRRMGVSLVLFTALILCDVLLWRSLPCNLLNPLDVGTLAGELLLLIGLCLRSWAAGTLHKSKCVTTTGPYSLIRNPLYVGSFLMMFGFSILIRDWIAVWLVLGPLLAMYLNKVRQEEVHLAHLFPDAWPQYVQTTPRFVPQFDSWPTTGGFSFKQWAYNREYQAVIASLGGLLAIWAWYHVTA